MGNSWKQVVEQMKGNWNKAVTESKKGFEGLPPGLYMVRVSDASVGPNNAGDKWQFKWQFTVIDGEHEGQVAYMWNNIGDVTSLSFLLRDLRKFGYDTDELDPSDLETVAKELAKSKPALKLTAKKNGEYTNYYIREVIDEGDDDDVEEVGVKEYEIDQEAKMEPEPEPEVKMTKRGRPRKAEVEPEPEPEEKSESEEEEEVELTEGMRVSWKDGKKTVIGTVVELPENEEDTQVKCQRDDNGKKVMVELEDLELVDED